MSSEVCSEVCCSVCVCCEGQQLTGSVFSSGQCPPSHRAQPPPPVPGLAETPSSGQHRTHNMATPASCSHLPTRGTG